MHKEAFRLKDDRSVRLCTHYDTFVSWHDLDLGGFHFRRSDLLVILNSQLAYTVLFFSLSLSLFLCLSFIIPPAQDESFFFRFLQLPNCEKRFNWTVAHIINSINKLKDVTELLIDFFFFFFFCRAAVCHAVKMNWVDQITNCKSILATCRCYLQPSEDGFMEKRRCPKRQKKRSAGSISTETASAWSECMMSFSDRQPAP